MNDWLKRFWYNRFRKADVKDFKENMDTRSDSDLLDFVVVILTFPNGKEQMWEMPFLKQEMKKRGMPIKYIKDYKKCEDKIGLGKRILQKMLDEREVDMKINSGAYRI